MTEFSRLLQYWQDEVDEMPEGYGVEIRLTSRDGLTETILRPARLKEPLLTPRVREIVGLLRNPYETDAETARRNGLSESAVAMARLRAATRMDCRNDRATVVSSAIRLGEIPPA